MRKQLKRFAESGIETLYSHIWGAVIMSIIAALLAIWYYLSGSGARWLYVYYAFGFLTACALMVGISSALIILDRRRLRVLEQLKNAKFISQEKGYLDHAANREKADREFTSLLFSISKEIADVGKTAARANKRTSSAIGKPAKAQRVATETARKLNKHAAKMEKLLARFEEITDLLIESDAGYIEWFKPETDIQKAQLIGQREIYSGLLESSSGSMEGVKAYRDSQASLKGVSQDLNGAIDRMVYVTDEIIAVVEKAQNHWQNAIQIINEKLPG